MTATVRITDSAGTVLATLQASRLSTTRKANAIGSFSVSAPEGATGYDALLVGRYVAIYESSWGAAAVFEGVIDDVTVAVDQNGTRQATATGGEISRELAWVTAGQTELADEGATITASTALGLLEDLCTGWTLTADATAGARTVYMAADGASVWAMIASLAQRIGAVAVRTARRTITLYSMPAASGLTAQAYAGDAGSPGVLPLVSLQRGSQGADVVTVVYPFGAGNAAVRLSLLQASASLSAGFAYVDTAFVRADGSTVTLRGVKHTANAAAWGVRARAVQFSEINPVANTSADIVAAANALQVQAEKYLTARSAPLESWSLVVVAGSSQAPLYSRVAVSYEELSASLVVWEVRDEWRLDGSVQSTLVVTAGAEPTRTGAQETVRGLESARTYSAHAQMAPNVYQLTYMKHIDMRTPARFRWRFDEAIVQLQAVYFDYQVLPLESTVKSVAGVTVDTSSEADHTHPFTSSGHSHTLGGHTHTLGTAPAHTHTIRLEEVTSAGTTGDLFYNETDQELHYIGSDVGTVVNYPTSSTGSSSPATSAPSADTTGTGGVWSGQSGMVTADGGHSHKVTPRMALQYGLFRDTLDNVPSNAELEYSLDGSTWTSLSTSVDGGGGWRRLALLDDLADADTFAPTQKDWQLQVRLSSSGMFEEYAYLAFNNTTLRVVDEAGTVVATFTLDYDFDRVLINRPRNQLITVDTNTGRVCHYDLSNDVTIAPVLLGNYVEEGLDAFGVAPSGQEYAGFGDDTTTASRLSKVWAATAFGISPWWNTAAGGESDLEADGVAASNNYIYTAASGYYRRVSRVTGTLTRVASPSGAVVWDITLTGLIVVVTDTATKVRLLNTDMSEASQFTPAGTSIRSVRVTAADTLLILGWDNKLRYYDLDGTLLATTGAMTTGVRDAAPWSVEVQRQAMIDAQLSVRSVVQAIVMS